MRNHENSPTLGLRVPVLGVKVGKKILTQASKATALRILTVCGFLMFFVLPGCAMIHSHSVSNYSRPPKTPAVAVSTEDTGNGYLMLSLPKLESGAKLKALCPGRLTGVETTLRSRNWFFLVQVYEERSEGLCLGN